MLVTECTPNEWQDFHNVSAQATVFTSNKFLGIYDGTVRRLLVQKGMEVVGGIVVVENAGQARQPMFQQYGGPMFADLSQMILSRRIELEFSVTGTLGEYLNENYDGIAFNCHWSVKDMRPFQWINYGVPESGQFEASVYYSSIVDITDPEDRSLWKKSRRSCLSRADRAGVSVKASKDTTLFEALYKKTFSRQEITLEAEHSRKSLQLVETFVEAGNALMLVGFVEGQPAGLACYLIDGDDAYYMFGANDPDYRTTEVGTAVMAEAFLLLNKEYGVKNVDMVGVNSPQRGSFKLSFGGRLVPYFSVSKRLTNHE